MLFSSTCINHDKSRGTTPSLFSVEPVTSNSLSWPQESPHVDPWPRYLESALPHPHPRRYKPRLGRGPVPRSGQRGLLPSLTQGALFSSATWASAPETSPRSVWTCRLLGLLVSAHLLDSQLCMPTRSPFPCRHTPGPQRDTQRQPPGAALELVEGGEGCQGLEPELGREEA